jgi:hypothetical protein
VNNSNDETTKETKDIRTVIGRIVFDLIDKEKKDLKDYKKYIDIEKTDLRILFHPIEEPLTPKSLLNKQEKIYELITNNPRLALKETEKAIKKYGECPRLIHYMSSSYIQLNDEKRGFQIAKKLFEDQPDYFFGRITYATLCIRNEEFEKIPEIFNNKYDLSVMFSEKNEFHFSEVMAFHYVMCFYFLEKNNYDVAIKYFFVLLMTYCDIIDHDIENDFKEIVRSLTARLSSYIIDKIKQFPKNFDKQFKQHGGQTLN